jgi:dATP pyrophosphohydrolase
LPEERDPVITEHHAYQWLDAAEAVKLTKSWSNQQAIEEFVINSVQ